MARSIEYIGPKEVAALLGVTQTTVYKWVRKREIPAIKIGGTIRIRRSDVELRNYETRK